MRRKYCKSCKGQSTNFDKEGRCPACHRRTDLFAVKAVEDGQWCYKRIYRSRRLAERARNDLRGSLFTQESKITHPPQFVVDAYVAYGNEIVE